MTADAKIKISVDNNEVQESFKNMVGAARKADQELQSVFNKSALVFAGISGIVIATTLEFAKYEKALVGVGKTTDISGQDLKNFGKEIKNLSKDIPVTARELLNIAQTAGQLGVKGSANLIKFTKTIAKLGVSTDLSTQAAASGLTTMINVAGESIDSIDILGSVIVSLGNDFNATESQILSVGQEVIKATQIFGVSSAQALAMATAMKSLGIEAEIGGTAAGRAFRTIADAVAFGGEELAILSDLTGKTGKQLKQSFEKDAAGAFQVFIESLGKLKPTEVTQALDSLGLSGERILRVLPVLASRSDVLADAFKQANKETKNATALNIEAAKAFATTDAALDRLQQRAKLAAQRIGERLAPDVREAADAFGDFADSVDEADDETIDFIVSIGKLIGTVAGVIAGLSLFGLGIAKIGKGLKTLKPILDVITTTGKFLTAAFLTVQAALIGGLLGSLVLVTKGLKDFAAANVFKRTSDQVDNLEVSLSRLKKVREELSRQSLQDPRFAKFANDRIDKIDQEISKLEDLKKNRDRVVSSGAGALQRPIFDTSGGVPEFNIPGLEDQQEVTIPFKFELQGEGIKDQTEKDAKNTTETLNREQRKQLDAIKDKNELLVMEQEGVSEKVIAVVKEQQALENEAEEAKLIRNKELREAEQENIAIERELLAEEKLQADIETSEAELERNQEFKSLLSQQERIPFETKLKMQQDFAVQSAKEQKKQLAAIKAFNKQRVMSEQQLQSAKLGFARASADAILAVSGDNFAAGLAISKGFAIADILIGDARQRVMNGILAANSASASGPAAPAVFAANLAALNATTTATTGFSLGAVAAQTVAAVARKPSGAQQGGEVPDQGGFGDVNPFFLERGEIIIPRNVAPTFKDKFSIDGDSDAGGGGGSTFVFNGDVIGTDEFIEETIIPKISNLVRHNNADLGLSS